MPVSFKELNEGRALVIHASGKLTRDDYLTFLPEVNRLIKRLGKISIVFDLHDFHGWEPAAAWEDTKFAVHHFDDVERLAVIGEMKWQKAMTFVCKPFIRADIRYFEHAEEKQALDWVQFKESESAQ